MGSQQADRPKRDAATRVLFAGLSDAGRVRPVNQDSFFAATIGKRGVLAIVADGMGGHSTGEVASQKAIEVVSRGLEKARHHPPAGLARAIQAANLEIYDFAEANPANYGMGTTLTALYLDDQVGLIGHIGDTRAYLLREGVLEQLTQDHSWVAERVRQGLLTEGEARKHRWRNVITNALGATPKVKLDLLHFEVRTGDCLLLCSDGISMLFSDEEIKTILSEHSPGQAVTILIAQANERGSPDNTTAVVLQVERVVPRPKNYALPSDEARYNSVNLGETMSGIEHIEETFPAQGPLAKLQRHPLYPYRYWLLGGFYLAVLVAIFAYFV